MIDRSAASRGMLRVPEITAYFWIAKGLSTAIGESTSDYLVHAMSPVLAVLLGFVGFLVALALQFSNAPLCCLDLLVRRRHGGSLRNDGRRRASSPACSSQR